MNGFKNRAKIDLIKVRLYGGQITFAQAMEEVEPLVDEMNAKGKEIARKYKRRYTKITASYVLR